MNLLYLGPLSPSGFLLTVTQQTSQDLPARTLRNHIDELDSPLEPFIMRLVVLDVLQNLGSDVFVLAGCHGRWCHDKRLGHFAIAVVGDRNHGAVVH